MPESIFNKPKYLTSAYPHRFAGSIHVTEMAGGIPTDPHVAEGWLKSKIADKDDLIRDMVAETMLERGVTADEAAKLVDIHKHLNGFKRDEHGLYYEGRQLKAALKEAASIRFPGQKWGSTRKGTLSFFPEHIFVVEDRLHLGVVEPTRINQRFVSTWRGTGIQYEEVVEDAKFDFTIISDFDFKAEEWALLWLTAEQMGVGASRSQGFGRFVVTRWERLDK